MLVATQDELAVSCWLDPEPVQVARAREQARKTLPSWGLGEHVDLTELIVSELVTNAMIHGRGRIEVRVSCAACGDLWVEVRDEGAGRPVRHRPGTDDERGRGLELIDGLIELCGGARGFVDNSNGPGKTVYVAVPLGSSPSDLLLHGRGGAMKPGRP
ncbi:MAG TPA: ATP-binding protein [Streptosporangiaceae bacterium]|nr:ATP-binding protein [Streptosporangiaceae bacterium]